MRKLILLGFLVCWIGCGDKDNPTPPTSDSGTYQAITKPYRPSAPISTVPTVYEANGDSVDFIVLGDFGQDNRHSNQKAVATKLDQVAVEDAIDFVLTVGDNFYGIGVKSTDDTQWKNKFEDMYKVQLVFWASLGNHDYGLNPDAQVAYSPLSDRWEMPSRYYTFVYKTGQFSVQFFALDTLEFVHPVIGLERQLEWLKQALAASTADVKVVFGHHPIYSTGKHGNTPGMADKLLPIFKQYGVKYYLCGHDHNLQLIEKEERYYVISGGGGAELYDFKSRPEYSLFDEMQYGFAVMKFSAGKVYFKFVLLDGTYWEKELK